MAAQILSLPLLIFIICWILSCIHGDGWNWIDAFVYLCETGYTVSINLFIDFLALAVPCYKHNPANYRILKRMDGTTIQYRGKLFLIF